VIDKKPPIKVEEGPKKDEEEHKKE